MSNLLAPPPKYTKANREGDWFHTSNDPRRKRIERLMMEEADKKKEAKVEAELIEFQVQTARWDGKPHEDASVWADKQRTNPKLGPPMKPLTKKVT